MRVTSEMMVTGSLRRLQGRLERYERAQTALSTGKWVNRPSDDPAQASRGLSLRAALASHDQELRAANDARSLVERADGELQTATTVLQRVRELAVTAGTVSNSDHRSAIATEMRQLRDELVDIANTRHRGRAMFAGFQNGDAVTSEPPWSYQGDTGQISRRLSDTDGVVVNVNGRDLFGFTQPADPANPNTFAAIDDLITAVANDDRAGLDTGLGELDKSLGRVYDGLSALGAAGARIDSAVQRTQNSRLTLKTELSEVEDVDIAEAIMDLQVEEVAYQATLQALGRSLPDTLVSFLR